MPTNNAEAFAAYWAELNSWRDGVSRRPKLTKIVKAYIETQAVRQCGDVARLPPFWTSRRSCSAPVRALTLLPYTMHVTKSTLVTAWDIICNNTGIWPTASTTTSSVRCAEATKALLDRVRAKRASGELRRDVSEPVSRAVNPNYLSCSQTMNCRDWRNVFVQEFEFWTAPVPGKVDDFQPQFQPLLSAAARCLKKIAEYISWATMVNSDGDVAPREAALFVASCHAWDRLSRRLDVKHGHRLQYKSHMRILARHLPAMLLSTMTPFIVLCEGMFERHLAMFEKKLMKTTDLAARSAHRLFPSLAAKYTSHNANVVEYLNPCVSGVSEKMSKSEQYDTLMFMPCTLQTSEDITAMRWRILEQVKGHRIEAF